MWLHGVGWFLPPVVEDAWLCAGRNGRLLCAAFLQPCAEPPLSLAQQPCFRHLLFGGPACPMGPSPTGRQVVARHQPPSGVQLWPGQQLQFTLRLPWPMTYRPVACQWPRDWSAHLRTWHLHHCPQVGFRWLPGPWLLACPGSFAPHHVAYHHASQQAEWTFLLRER